MKIHFTKRAESTYRRLPPQIQKKVDKQLLLLASNYRHPSLRTRKMGGEDHFEGRIDKKHRFTFVVESGDIYILTIGLHDEGLGKN
ncbi:hypothetical protein A3J17_02980 [Candidatus Curtissbacteria bacterium RIFCSPLOWO2_02_FULL_40_11]|uniref:Cytotoxic translational repressor of toxin-antitoxin stability system n=2 Tax=Candidatus Curtissiibacteriota TaxID=1752717 RepID=A0A1F5GBK3_9BACT|nr:MAG: hypothetical protein A2775_00440 [Candidatus Curtissbacteria bacterium RIFCSPHIGHO2_01_FULL_39_57]OGD89207.1 MAG: hypothetical protein A3D04_00100 [Candidatus Curtissbacteria bacterium RIFCSPHIGHO2_02_FULL_40_16b]OGE00883.1 MAG: hypothetical protein A3J17_02980 [Candidatus Curtissbacteria bacterium RIFCSPLOWO2_02_FULL_40_11]OGE13988.1 MAG: hypothetical protein A3G14_03925 [Candidatus Curtissbacteria bacterium RIFCSPLOWO2_12_FULL_38_9]